MKVGDYVRTKEGIIAKLINIDDEDFEFDTGIIWNFEYYKDCADKEELENVIYKYSSNIIDLIEVGDYVNGHKVIEHAHEPRRLYVENVYVGGKGQTTIENYSYELNSKYCYDEPYFIKSIVTKEKFESMEYKL